MDGVVPMPLEPPCTRKTSPGPSPVSMNTLDHTMQVTSGSAAAVGRSMPAGLGSSCPAGTATRSAYPPRESSAHTSSPTAQPDTPSPASLMIPLHSRPRMSLAPGGGG